jgi:predicted nuclease of predicted toxin-antitoxin system
MRLLFDQNVSYRVVKQLKPILTAIIGVREVGFLNADDYQIWEYARKHEYTVVTFDKDIPDIESVWGFPPKIIWLRTGNLSNAAVVTLFLDRLDEFARFIADERKGCLMVYFARTT